jgi:hypothetical protein
MGTWGSVTIASFTPVAGAIYLSPTGSDTAGNGSAGNPYATIGKASAVASAGKTIYLRGGTYTAVKAQFSKSGTAGSRITIRGYPGETAVLDGTGATFASTDALLYISGSYVTVQNIVVANSGGRGVNSFGNTNTIFDTVTVHDTQTQAFLLGGDSHTVQNCEVYNACLSNTNGSFGTGGWPAVVHSNQDYPSGLVSTNMTVKDCYIHDSWGEGIDMERTNGALLTNNTVVNTFSVLIYCDDSQNITITNNYLAVTNSNYYRRDNNNFADGISLASETQSQPLQNDVIANNLIAGGTNNGINFWWTAAGGANNSYTNISVLYNTVKGTVRSGVHFDTVGATSPTPTGCLLKDNIIYAGSGGSSLSIGQMLAWTFTNNDWPSGLPSGVSGSGNIASDPQFVGATTTGSPAANFKPGSSSPVLGAGTPVSTTIDYFGVTRSATGPTIGFSEQSG